MSAALITSILQNGARCVLCHTWSQYKVIFAWAKGKNFPRISLRTASQKSQLWFVFFISLEVARLSSLRGISSIMELSFLSPNHILAKFNIY